MAGGQQEQQYYENPHHGMPPKKRVHVTSKQLFRVSWSCFPPEHEPRSRTRSIQQIFMWYKTDHLVLRRVSDNAQRIQTVLHRFDRFLIKTAQKDDTSIRITQMFRRPVIDRSLAFLRDPILISPSKPVDRFIPFVDAGLGLSKSL